jgi:hypothetical protein
MRAIAIKILDRNTIRIRMIIPRKMAEIIPGKE